MAFSAARRSAAAAASARSLTAFSTAGVRSCGALALLEAVAGSFPEVTAARVCSSLDIAFVRSACIWRSFRSPGSKASNLTTRSRCTTHFRRDASSSVSMSVSSSSCGGTDGSGLGGDASSSVGMSVSSSSSGGTDGSGLGGGASSLNRHTVRFPSVHNVRRGALRAE